MKNKPVREILEEYCGNRYNDKEKALTKSLSQIRLTLKLPKKLEGFRYSKGSDGEKLMLLNKGYNQARTEDNKMLKEKLK